MLSRFALFALLVGCAPTPASIKFDGEAVVTVHSLDAIDASKATVLDAEGKAIEPQPQLSWSASPADVGTLEGGKITPVANGDLTVEAAVGEVKGSYKVHVALPDAIAISGYTAEAGLPMGGTVTLSAAVKAGEDAVEGQKVEWSSSDAAIATVDAGGVVTGVAEGTATITATSGALTQTQEITVGPAAADAEGGPGAVKVPVKGPKGMGKMKR